MTPDHPAMDPDALLWAVGLIIVGMFGWLIGTVQDHPATTGSGGYVVLAGLLDVWRNGR
jgi:hypothetical protein